MRSVSQSSRQLRQAFLRYFERHGHAVEASAPLVPQHDPSLLFVNAGMVPFKDYFTGAAARPADQRRVASAQKCVRAGGKHNDLDNVGRTARHHTFFEMLGNFSFQDYFKEEAIVMAWRFLRDELALPVERLRVSVHEHDDESARLWTAVTGLTEEEGRIVRFGDADNFWSMGDGPGPCGPCTEIFWDQKDDVDGDRWLEVWNLVFMQFDRQSDGELTPLAQPCVDTGMGLERMAAVLQGVPSNYDIDSMRALLDSVANVTRTPLAPADADAGVAQRVIADHVRAAAFLIADGVVPGPVGRGYVLRRLIRRAATFGATSLGMRDPFLAGVLPALVVEMADAYPELREAQAAVEQIIGAEEASFQSALQTGMRMLRNEFSHTTTTTTKTNKDEEKVVLSGETAFRLYDACGVPLELTTLVAEREFGATVDVVGFEERLRAQKALSRRAAAAAMSSTDDGTTAAPQLPDGVRAWRNSTKDTFEFTGYTTLEEPAARIVHALVDHEQGCAWIMLSPCPFYGEAGGQVGDTGVIEVSPSLSLDVVDATRPFGDDRVVVRATGAEEAMAVVREGVSVRAVVDAEARESIRVHHTATHLLHTALKDVLGDQVVQAGSLVAPDRLRFDVSHGKPLSADERRRIEEHVNAACLAQLPVGVVETSKEDAVERLQATALFGEKYGDVVRVVRIGSGGGSGGDGSHHSAELCGGTHVDNTEACFPFTIVKESAVAAGTRRLIAKSGRAAVGMLLDAHTKLSEAADTLNTSPADVPEAVRALSARVRELNKTVRKLEESGAGANAGVVSRDKGEWSGTRVSVHWLDPQAAADTKAMRIRAVAAAKRERTAALHVFISRENGKCTIAGAHADSGALMRALIDVAGGRGGGSAALAQGVLDAPGELLPLIQ